MAYPVQTSVVTDPVKKLHRLL